MPIPISCSDCGVSYQITDAAAGKRIRCKDCGEPISVPGGGGSSQRPPSRPARPAPRPASRPQPQLSRPPASIRPDRSRRDEIGGGIRQRRERKKRSGGGGGSKGLLFAGLGVGGLVVVGLVIFLVVQGFGGGEVQDGLTRHGPAPQDYDPVPPAPGVTAVTYQSEGRTLKAWMTKPAGPGPHPAVVFFHGGFAFGLGDLESCEPFQNEGFIVLAPSFRGENGNPGDFEMMGGEVDDAVAAIQWLSQQPGVDTNNIYTFGHSVGGGISALVSLRQDAPIVHGGSTGGLYDQITFAQWAPDTPFDYRNAKENNRRVLKDRESEMVHDHYGYYGTSDSGAASVAAQMNAGGRLKTIPVPGDHFTSVTDSMRRYLQVIQRTRRPSAGGQSPPPVVASNTQPPADAGSSTTQSPPPGTQRPSVPSFRPPSFSGRSARNRPTGFPPGFPSGGPSGRPGFSGRSGRFTGSPLSGVPGSAETDEDLATLRTIMQSGDRSKVSRGITVLTRSSRKDEAAAVLALAVSTDRTRVLIELPRFGASGETQLLKLLSSGLDQTGESLAISGLARCGTQKSLPVLDQLAQAGGANAFPARATATQIRAKLGQP